MQKDLCTGSVGVVVGQHHNGTDLLSFPGQDGTSHTGRPHLSTALVNVKLKNMSKALNFVQGKPKPYCADIVA